ncbi:MAG TPA: flavodoxin family protein [Planctomycetaceae bacterium]|nr:flavodoxin family protein [Planctomycetaceae bacterium]
MKVLGICGSPRKGGNTEFALNTTLEAIRSEGIETELIRLADSAVKPCVACYGCTDGRCIRNDSTFDAIYEKCIAADGLLVGSPVYFGSATPQIMSLLDRVGFVARRNGNLLRRKVGASIAVARRAGTNFTFAQLNYFFLIAEMIVPGSTYWNGGIALERGEIAKDEEALQTFTNLGKNMAWLLKKVSE